MASRFEYTQYSHNAKVQDHNLTIEAKALEERFEALPAGREKALALTKLEEAVMWARKALRDVP